MNDIQLYIYSLRQLCPPLTAADRVNYARYLPLYHIMLSELPPDAYALLENNGLSVSRSSLPGCRIPVDRAIEQTINRSAKTVGGVVGFRAAYYRWCLTRHKKAGFLEVVREDLGMTSTESPVHASSRSSHCQHFERDVQRILGAFIDFINPFAVGSSGEQLYCVSSGIPARPQITHDLLNYTMKGEQAAVEFIQKRLVEKSETFHAPLKRMKLQTSANMAVLPYLVRGSFDKQVTKQRHSVSFPNIKNPKYTFCRGVSITDSVVVKIGMYHVEITLGPTAFSIFRFFSKL